MNVIKSTEYYSPEEFINAGYFCLQVGIQLANEQKGGSEVIFKDLQIIDFRDMLSF